jgi:hypothetical protein
MLKKQRWAAALSLLSCLTSVQAYAGEDSKYPSNRYKPDAVSTGSGATKDANTSAKTAGKDTQNAKAQEKTAPVQTPKSPAVAEKPAGKTATFTKHPAEAANITPTSANAKELQSLSIVESILSILLTGLFFLVLIKGKMFKQHE